MPAPRAVAPDTLTAQVAALKVKRGALSALSRDADVSMSSLARIGKGKPVEVKTIQKLEAHLVTAVTTPAPRANGLAHLEAYTGALMDGMEFMRLQVMRYLQGASH